MYDFDENKKTRYKLTSEQDGNVEIELGNHDSVENAAIDALDILGWMLVKGDDN